ncbi:uncharacterized protein LOC126672804 [Mercurialis annua]|uniref:uncharacterized protein LOC126672804 n=1 Tax=Mercurialis annua TaxID=3986 RepID=UPI0024AD7952|nr:uncharacterized protein LOC126672804 [Mercurialis annua]
METDRSWMYKSHTNGLLTTGYKEHVKEFVQFALRHPACMSGVQIKCPCPKRGCRNTSYRDVDEVEFHLLKNGFVKVICVTKRILMSAGMRGQGGSGDPTRGRGRGNPARGRGRGNPAVRAPVEDILVQGQQQEVEAAPPVQPRQPGEPPVELDAQGRALSFPNASRERLLNPGPISRSMREIFRKCWFENGRAWRFLTAEQTNFYLEEFKIINCFKKEYWWNAADYSDDVIKSVFTTHAANRYKDIIRRMREKDKKHTSISQEIWDSWKAFWASEDEKKKSDIARANRMSEPAGAGSGPVRHTGGSRSAIRHMDVLKSSAASLPQQSCILGCTKADKGVMVDKRAQDMSDAIAQRLAAASQPLSGDGGSSSTAYVDETQLFLDIEGVNKKRRVYGLGSAITSAYVDTTSTSRARTRSTQSHPFEEEIERRVQAGIQDGLCQITTKVEALRAQQASADERMAQIVQAELAK